MSDNNGKNPAAVALARLAVAKRRKNPDKMREDSSKGGKIGGKARAKALSPERRREIARNAVAARIAKKAAKIAAENAEVGSGN